MVRDQMSVMHLRDEPWLEVSAHTGHLEFVEHAVCAGFLSSSSSPRDFTAVQQQAQLFVKAFEAVGGRVSELSNAHHVSYKCVWNDAPVGKPFKISQYFQAYVDGTVHLYPASNSFYLLVADVPHQESRAKHHDGRTVYARLPSSSTFSFPSSAVSPPLTPLPPLQLPSHASYSSSAYTPLLAMAPVSPAPSLVEEERRSSSASTLSSSSSSSSTSTSTATAAASSSRSGLVGWLNALAAQL